MEGSSLLDAMGVMGVGLYTAPAGLLAVVLWGLIEEKESLLWLAAGLHDMVVVAALCCVISVPAILIVMYGSMDIIG